MFPVPHATVRGNGSLASFEEYMFVMFLEKNFEKPSNVEISHKWNSSPEVLKFGSRKFIVPDALIKLPKTSYFHEDRKIRKIIFFLFYQSRI